MNLLTVDEAYDKASDVFIRRSVLTVITIDIVIDWQIYTSLIKQDSMGRRFSIGTSSFVNPNQKEELPYLVDLPQVG